MPADEELIVWRKDATVKHLKRRLEQGRPAALQNHGAFLGEGAGDAALIRTARQSQFHEGVSPGGPGQRQDPEQACSLKKTTAA